MKTAIPIIVFLIIVGLAIILRTGWRPSWKRSASSSSSTHAGGGTGAGGTPPTPPTPAKTGGPLHWFLTVVGIAIVLFFVVPIIFWLTVGIYSAYTAPKPAPRKFERVFVRRDSCTTPCKMDVFWEEKLRSDGFPFDATYFHKNYSVHYSGRDDEPTYAKDFNPGKASFVSPDKTNLNVKIEVGRYEMREVK